MLDLQKVVLDVGSALFTLDRSGIPFKQFQPGVGPYGEPQLVRIIAEFLKQVPEYGIVKTKRTPDLLISGQWALEFKITRPFGDNGREAENWSVNLLHPYEGNVSLIGDCIKLARMATSERKAAVVIGYEHTPPLISLVPLLNAFEVVAKHVMNINLSPRVQNVRAGLCHPVHQQVLVAAWEVLNKPRAVAGEDAKIQK